MSGDGTKKHYGNAFAVGQNLLLTCSHVLVAAEGSDETKRKVSFQPSSAKPGALTIQGKHLKSKEIDLAFLKVKEDLVPIPVEKHRVIAKESRCYLCGTAPNSNFCVTRKEVESPDGPETYFQLKGGSASGRSGSPVVEIQNGKPILVGVAFKGGEVAAVTPVHTAARVLCVAKELGVEVELADRKSLGPDIKDMFPDDPHANLVRELNGILKEYPDLKEMVGECDPKFVVNEMVDDAVFDRNESRLPEFFREMERKIKRGRGLRGVDAVNLREFLGGLTILQVRKTAISDFRESFLDKIISTGAKDVELGHTLKNWLCRVTVVYQLAVADCLEEVGHLFKAKDLEEADFPLVCPTKTENRIERLPTLGKATTKDSRAKTILAEVVIRVMGVKADDDYFNHKSEKFRSFLGALEEALRDGDGYHIFGPRKILDQWIQSVRSSEYWEVSRRIIFYDESGRHEEMMPQYDQVLRSLFKLLQAIDRKDLESQSNQHS